MLALDCVNWAPAVYAKPPHCTAAGRRHPLPPRAPPPAAAASGVFCCCRHLLSSRRVCQRAPQRGADNQRRGWHAAQPAAAADARRAPRPCGGGRGGRAAGCGDRWEQWEGSGKGKGGQQEEVGRGKRAASPHVSHPHASIAAMLANLMMLDCCCHCRCHRCRPRCSLLPAAGKALGPWTKDVLPHVGSRLPQACALAGWLCTRGRRGPFAAWKLLRIHSASR